VPVTEEMLDAVEVYAKHVEKLNGEKHVEQRVYIEHSGEQLFGTSDTFVVNVAEQWVEVVDFKYGQGVLVHPDSSQLKIYGLGALNQIGPFEDIRVIDLTVVQPRADLANPVRTASFKVSELADWEHRILIPALDRIAAGDQTETPGDHCKWCVRAGECQALAELAMSNARTAFGEIPPDPKGMTNDEMGVLLDHAQMISDWVGKVRNEAMTRAEKGTYIPGWKLVAKRAVRKWSDPNGAVTELMRLGVDAMAIMRVETIGAVETAMKRAKIQPKVLDRFTIKASSGSTLVSEKDGRPAIDNSAQNIFTDVVET
jgi:hypothetical protein